jgi:hypothetical protein
MYTRNILQRA